MVLKSSTLCPEACILTRILSRMANLPDWFTRSIPSMKNSGGYVRAGWLQTCRFAWIWSWIWWYTCAYLWAVQFLASLKSLSNIKEVLEAWMRDPSLLPKQSGLYRILWYEQTSTAELLACRTKGQSPLTRSALLDSVPAEILVQLKAQVIGESQNPRLEIGVNISTKYLLIDARD